MTLEISRDRLAQLSGSTAQKRRLMVVSHTHWDREWYLPYQSFRVRLVGLIDMLIELFDSDPEYRHFLLDGHTIPLEDYLEVRPDRFDDLQRIVQQGKLQIGPWYIIPDEFLPGGEALVRNFLRGHRVAARFGPVMKVGYIPDPFGQIAHMPAILRGFGIDCATMWRGTTFDLTTTEFFWRAPDGSEVLTIHKPHGYGVGATLPVSTKPLLQRLAAIRDALEPLATTPYVLLMNGSDHLPPQVDLSSMIAAANAELDDAELEHVSLPEVFRRVREAVGEHAGEWPRHDGEFRSGDRAHLLPGVLSARMWIKQLNQECEDLLAHWAEPFSLWADLLKRDMGPEWQEPLPPATAHMPFPTSAGSVGALVDRAWRYLLENQPHDSICGCSVDAVHEEMRQRYDWVRQVGEEIVRQSLRTIGALGPGDPLGTITVFNPTPQPASQAVTATVPWEDEQPIVALIAPDGTRVPAVKSGDTQRFVVPEGAPAGFDRQRADIRFVARDVPGYGYRTYRLETGGSGEAQHATQAATHGIENEYFSVEADVDDGTLTVRDRRTGRILTGLNRFVDGGDRGDEYNFCGPEHDRIVDRPAARPTTTVERAPEVQRLTVDMVYALPARLADDRAYRSDATVEERITTTITLAAGVPRIDVHTVVHNVAEDHRLRVQFPSGIRTDVANADQHFGVVRRSTKVPPWDQRAAEQPVGMQPQKAFVSVDDGTHGLTIANRGLPEYEALEGDDGVTVALTLLRCVGWLSRGDLSSRRGNAGPELRTPGAQMHGRWTFDYSIIPHAGDWHASGAHVLAVQFLRPARARWNRHGIGRIGPEGSLLAVSSPDFPVTCIKRAEDGDGAVVRAYNIAPGEAETDIDLLPMDGAVTRTDLNEEHIAEERRAAAGVHVRARTNEIVTLRFRGD